LGKSFLGGELFANLVWSPFSDMQYILGAGVFLPAVGNNWPGATAVWRIDFSTIFSLY